MPQILLGRTLTVVLLGLLILGEKLTLLKTIGIFLGFLSLYLLTN